MFKSSLMQEIQARGFLHSCTATDAFDEYVHAGNPVTVYAGFDCTADSLHVGNLMTIMLLRLFKKHGCNVVPLIGTATTRIGDPSGKDSARPLLDDATIIKNCKGVTQSIAYILGLNDDNWVEYNADWTLGLNLVDFLRDVGRKISVNSMLSLESVKRRQENNDGIPFLEFTYSLFQANDFLQLHLKKGVNVQIGGSDQWGNITMGTELIRKSVPPGAEVFGLTHPLITDSNGDKFGKTAGNAVWLNTEKLSDYDFWQFWRNVDDRDVKRLMLIFTDITPDDIETLVSSGDINACKKLLATKVTEIVRGYEASLLAEQTAVSVFAGEMTDDMPTIDLSVTALSIAKISALLVRSGLCSSNTDAKRSIEQGGIRLNDVVMTSAERCLIPNDFNSRSEAKLSKGRKNHIRVKLV